MADFSITCTQENLLTGLSRVAPIAGRNNQLPILQHVLIQAKDGALHLTTTDLEIGVHTIIGGKVEKSGAIAVPAKSLLAYVQQLPTGNPITLQAESERLQVFTTGFSAQFPVASADDFPLLPGGDKAGAITITGDELRLAMQKVMFAAARDETRPEIRGVYVVVGGGALRVAATDSFRLAEDVVSYTGKTQASFIIPLMSAHELVRLFSGKDTVTVAPQDSHILFSSDETEVSSRLIDGTYPDYQQIIPASSKTTITVSSEELLRALKTLTVFLPRDSRRVELDVQPEKEVIIARVAGGVGEGVVEIPITGAGDRFTVLVNIQYILEGVQHIAAEECDIGLGGEASPIVMRPHGKEKKQQYVYVVMPIRS